MRTDTELFKDKIEINLDGRQVFYLFFGGAVIASLVFVLGVMVGKRVEARSNVTSAAMASASDDPLAALDQLAQTPDSEPPSFRSALMQGDDDPRYDVDIALAAKAAAKKLAAKPAPKPEAGPAAKLAAKPEAKIAANIAAKPEAKLAAKPEAKIAANIAAKPEAKIAANIAAKPEAKIAANIAAKPAAESDAAADESENLFDADYQAEQDVQAEPAANQAPKFTLQLSSFQDRVEADSFFDKLRSAGYQPYIVEAEVPDKGLWYRVRLGAYPSYDEAIKAKKSFENKQRIIAYVTRM